MPLNPYDPCPCGSGKKLKFCCQNIADEMERITAAGFAGTTLSFVDYVKEFPYFRDEVLPRLERKGLREPFSLDEAASQMERSVSTK